MLRLWGGGVSAALGPIRCPDAYCAVEEWRVRPGTAWRIRGQWKICPGGLESVKTPVSLGLDGSFREWGKLSGGCGTIAGWNLKMAGSGRMGLDRSASSHSQPVQSTRVAFYTETSKDVLLVMMVMPGVPPERLRRTEDIVFEDDDNFNSNQPIIGWTREMRFRPLLPQISLRDVGKGRPWKTRGENIRPRQCNRQGRHPYAAKCGALPLAVSPP